MLSKVAIQKLIQPYPAGSFLISCCHGTMCNSIFLIANIKHLQFPDYSFCCGCICRNNQVQEKNCSKSLHPSLSGVLCFHHHRHFAFVNFCGSLMVGDNESCVCQGKQKCLLSKLGICTTKFDVCSIPFVFSTLEH